MKNRQSKHSGGDPILGYIGSLSDSQMKQVNTALKCSLEL